MARGVVRAGGLRAKRLNLFVLLKGEGAMNALEEMLRNLCSPDKCVYTVNKSCLVERFYYVELYPTSVELGVLRSAVEEGLNSLRTLLNWYKVEVVEVK